MSVSELEKRTCHAYRLALRWRSGHLSPPRTLFISSISNISISDVRFLPGRSGDWILTVSKSIWDVITIWDLSSEKGMRRACEWSPRGGLFTGVAMNTDAGSDATLAVSVSNYGEEAAVSLISLRTDENGACSLQAIHRIPSRMKPTKLHGDFLALSDDVWRTVIWNWKLGISAILEEPDADTGLWQPNRAIQAVFAHRSVLLVRASSIYLFPEPELEEIPLKYTPIAQHSFGWIDGVCVTQTHSTTPGLSILLRGESDDPWASGVHSLDHYNLLPNPDPDDDSNEPPYIFPPALIARVNAVRGSLGCRNVVLGPCGTAAWIQPQDRARVGLLHGNEEYPLQAIHRASGNETLMVAVFPGPLRDRDEGAQVDGVADTRGTAVHTNELNDWVALDYDEEIGRVVLFWPWLARRMTLGLSRGPKRSGNGRASTWEPRSVTRDEIDNKKPTSIFVETTMVQLTLPFDIIDDVVYHLRGDVDTLLQCCQVSRAFLVPSRKALFAIISFDHAVYSSAATVSPNYPYDDDKLGATNRRWNEMCAFLVADPQYILCIEELWFNGLTWAIKETTFSTLLSRLMESESLRVLSLAFSVGTKEGWSVLPAELSEPLHALFRSPHLHTLRIHLIDRCACTIPVTVFAAVPPTLKRLSIGGESIFSIITGEWCPHQETQALEVPRTEKVIQLEVLEIGCMHTELFRDFLLSPCSPYDLGSVRAVVVRTWSDPHGLSDILKMTEASIETLVWFHPKARDVLFVESTKLWLMKHLRSLVLIVSDEDQMEAAFSLFKRGAITDALKEICLYIDDPLGTLRTDAVCALIDQVLGDVVAIYGRRDVKIITLTTVTMLNERSAMMMKRYYPRLSKVARLYVGEEDMETFEQSIRATMAF
ncbi:hypothetical protein DXG01_014099 [Tephrocybe rancida]|nr:hypothetical protein DXG01_014099 [Tephrocybe rancida]